MISPKDHDYDRAPYGSNLPRSGSMKRWNLEYDATYKVNNGDIEYSYSDDMYKSIVSKIKILYWSKKILIFLDILCFVLSIVLSFFTSIDVAAILMYTGLLFILLILLLYIFGIIKIEYNLSCVDAECFDYKSAILENFSSCNYIWLVLSKTQNTFTRVTSGAKISFRRAKVNLELNKLPYYLKVKGIPTYTFFYDDAYYIFLFDALLVINKNKVAVIKYTNLKISFDERIFVEDKYPNPRDAKYLYSTWQYVCKDGSPDKRFKNNVQHAVFKYADVLIQDANGFYLFLIASNLDKAKKFQHLFDYEDTEYSVKSKKGEFYVELEDNEKPTKNYEMVDDRRDEKHLFVSVKFKNSAKSYDYLADGFDEVIKGNYVVVEGIYGDVELEVLDVQYKKESEMLLPFYRYKNIKKIVK